MDKILSNLEPEAVFRHFEALTKIPRESGNEKEVSDFLVSFAQQQGLNVIQEKDSLNVIIEKPASPGYENSPKVILQGHMDMVCVKTPDMAFDFKKDAIPIIVDGDTIRTKGTTLGADNGIAVAMIMAILESNSINHPALAALITSEEETGMGGAVKLNPENISGDILINIDSEEEGTALASCAGGINTLVEIPLEIKPIDIKNACAFSIQISGLLGGHSGMEIHKGRANAIRLLGRTLNSVKNAVGSEFSIASIGGGEKMNAIANNSKATIVVSQNEAEKVKSIVSKCRDDFSNEFKTVDPGLSVSIESIEVPGQVFTVGVSDSVVDMAVLLPNGVQTVSSDIEGLVESSSNIGVLIEKNGKIVFDSAVRSSVKSLKYEIVDRIKALSKLCNAEVVLKSDYPEWEYRQDSQIRDLMMSVYRDKYGKDLKIDAIHAGLECGLLKEKVGDIDMVSIGPDLCDVHSPNESMSISSTKRVFEFLCDVLNRIK